MSPSPIRLLLLLVVACVACSEPPAAATVTPELIPPSVASAKYLAIVVPERSVPAAPPVPSASTPSGPTAAMPRPEELSLLWRLGRGFGAVLKRGEIATTGAARKVPMSKDPGDFLLEKDVPDSALGSFAGLRGRVLDLYGKKGVECSAKVTGFRAIGGYTMWDEQEAADSIWQSLGEQFLVAVVEPSNPSCKPLWARARDLPKPIVLAPRNLTAEETRRATRALAKTAVAQSLQGSYAKYREELREPYGPMTWDALEPREWRAVAFEHPERAATYVSAELSAGEGCGDFGGYALGFFESGSAGWTDATGDGSPEFPNRPLFGLVPSAAVILEPGGPVYFVHADALYANAGAGMAPLTTIGRIGTTCGC